MNEPTAIQTLILQAEQTMMDRAPNTSIGAEANGFLFTGNFQQSVPEALIFSSALQAVDVRVWMALRASIQNPKIPGCLPQRQELVELIHVSAPTISKALANLRCLRWITRCKEVRNNQGQFVGYIYLMHDAPLSLQDTLEIDAHYILSLEEQSKHKSKTGLRALSAAILMEIDQLYGQTEIHSETRLELINDNLLNQHLRPGGLGGFGQPATPTTDQKVTQRKNLSPVDMDNSPEIDQKVTHRKNLSTAPVDNSSKQGQKATQSNILSPAPVDNSPEIDQKVTQGKNLSLVDVRSSCSSSYLTNYLYTQSPDSEKKSSTTKPASPDWPAYSDLLSCPESIRQITAQLYGCGLLTTRDLAGFTRLLKLYPTVEQADIIDQVLGNILASLYGHRAEKIKNPAAYLKSLAQASKQHKFNLDTWGQMVAEARQHKVPHKITWTAEKLASFEGEQHEEL